MNKQHPQSFIRGFVETVQNEPDFAKAKAMTLTAIKDSYICETSKKRMTMIVTYQIFTQDKLVKYLYNSLSVFEGYSLNRREH